MVTHAGKHQRQGEERDLGDSRPASPPTEERGDIPIHEGRPEELEGPGCLRQSDEPHDTDVDTDVPHPVGDGEPYEPKGHP